MKIIYNVTVSIDYAVSESWLVWMKSTHIPEMLETGKFLEAKLSKIMAEESGGASYSIQYLCENNIIVLSQTCSVCGGVMKIVLNKTFFCGRYWQCPRPCRKKIFFKETERH